MEELAILQDPQFSLKCNVTQSLLKRNFLETLEPGQGTPRRRLGVDLRTGGCGEDAPFRPQELRDGGLDPLLRLVLLRGGEVERPLRDATVEAGDEPLGAARHAPHLGPNSIENFWLEFWLEKSPEFWIEIP